MINIFSTGIKVNRQILKLLSIAWVLFTVTAHGIEEEQTVFFQARGDQTGTDDGGTAIWSLRDKTWRWWFQDVEQAHVSPDGQKVAYIYQGDLIVADIEGQNPTVLFQGSNPVYSPKWSPNGDRVAFTGNGGDPLLPGLYFINSDGSGLEFTPKTMGPFSWSPDGLQIAYMGWVEKPHIGHQLYSNWWEGKPPPVRTYETMFIMDVSSGASTQIYDPSWISVVLGSETVLQTEKYLRGPPIWGPSGSRIAIEQRIDRFFIDPGPASGIVGGVPYYEGNVGVLSANGGGFIRISNDHLTQTADNWGIWRDNVPGAWSPDGQQLLYTKYAGSVVEQGTYLSGGIIPGERINGFLGSSLQWVILNQSGVKVDILLPAPVFKIDKPYIAKVKVTSFEETPQMISFPQDLVASSTEGYLDLVFESAEPFELTPNDSSRTFEFRVVPRKFGLADLTTEILIVSEAGTTTNTAETEVLVNPLKVTLRAKPLIGGDPIVNIEIIKGQDGEPDTVTDEDGNPITPKIEIVVENMSDQDVSSTIQGLDPRSRDSSAVVGRIETLGVYPIDMGTLVKGTPVTHEIDLKVNEDGRFEFTATLTGVFAGSIRQFNAVGIGAPIAVGEPYPVEVELEFVNNSSVTNENNGAFFMVPGSALSVRASVKNLTTISTLHFKGLETREKSLNAMGGTLTDEAGNLIDPPFAHDHTIDANATVLLTGLITTVADGPPSGIVTWELPDKSFLIDDFTGDRTELAADDFLVKNPTEGWLGDKLTVRLIQDNSQPPKPPPLSTVEAMAYFGKGVVLGIRNWTWDNFELIGAAGDLIVNPSRIADAVGDGSRAVWEAAEMASLGWESMTEAEKQAFVINSTDEIQRRGLLLYDTGVPWEPGEIDSVKLATRAAVDQLFIGVSNAYASDDPEKIAEMWGRVSGNIAMEVISAAIPSPDFKKYTTATELAQLAKNVDNVRDAANTQQQLLRKLHGVLDRATALEAWGIGGKQLEKTQEVLGALGMKGYARERSPLSHSLSEVWDEAVLKPEAMKPKGFSDLDRLILGENLPKVKGKPPGKADLDFDALTGIFLPEPQPALEVALRKRGGLSEETIQAALTRADARRKEFLENFPKFQEWKNGKDGGPPGIPVEFNYRDNDALPFNPAEPNGATRAFDYETVDVPGGTTVYLAKMANKNGDMRLITGDIDWIHFSWLDGTPLDPKVAGELYDILQRCCGLQHGDTATWLKKGQAVFNGKANQLSDYLLGKKALLEVTGDSLRAARIQPNLTRFAPDGRNHLLFFDAGSKSLLKALSDVQELEARLALLKRLLPPRKVIMPIMWVNHVESLADWSYRDDVDALMIRQGDDDNLESFDGTEWVPWAPAQASLSVTHASKGPSYKVTASGDSIKLTPTTVMTRYAEEGDTVLEILNLPKLWSEELAGHVGAWFEIGHTIVIGPGEFNQEVRKIVGLNPVTLDLPIAFEHPEGTIVSVLPASIEIGERNIFSDGFE